MRCLTVSVAVLCLFSGLTFAEEQTWQLQKEDNGIQVFTKDIQIEVPNQAVDSEQKAFRGITIINVSMDKMLDTMRDVPNFDQWLHNNYEPAVIQTINKDTRIVYQKTHTPWPTDDRDSVLKQWISKDGNDYFLYMQSTEHDQAPVNDEFVRVPYFDGFWKFTPIDDNKLEVTYEAAFDSGGSIPAFVSNLFIVDTPYYSLEKLRAYVE